MSCVCGHPKHEGKCGAYLLTTLAGYGQFCECNSSINADRYAPPAEPKCERCECGHDEWTHCLRGGACSSCNELKRRCPAYRPPTPEPAESEGKGWKCPDCGHTEMHLACEYSCDECLSATTAPPDALEDARAWMAKEYDIPLKNVPDDGRLEVMAQFAIEYATKQIERQTPAIIERFIEEVEADSRFHWSGYASKVMRAVLARRSGGEGK